MSYPETLPADPDPFDELKTGAEVAAFVYKRFGPGGLRDLLAHDGTTREWALDVVAELDSAGLRKAATIAAEVAATKPPMTDLVHCPYNRAPYVDTIGNQTNIRAWQRDQERRQREHELKRSKPAGR
jgi:hypothetical protein